VAPAAIETEVGETVTFVRSLLASVTVTPPAGAGDGNEMANAADWPGATVTFAGRMIALPDWTLAVAVALATFGALAVMVAVPAATPVTATVAVVWFCGMFTDAGIVTIPPGDALNRTDKPPAGAGVDNVRVRFLVSGPVRLTLCGEKLRDAVVWTARVVDPKPGPEAVILADPTATPVTWGWVAGTVDPAAIITLPGEMLTFVASLLVRVTVTPPTGAGLDNVTGNGADWPTPTDTFEGRMIVPATTTVTSSVPLVTFGALVLAVMVAVPAPTPDTVTFTFVVFCAIVTCGGTVAAPELLDVRLTVKPPAGAGPERFSATVCEPPAPMLTSCGENVRAA
jgi:hypothetical protein